MSKVAIFIFADTEGSENLGRLANGLLAAKELSEKAENDVQIIFDGAGTKWVKEFAKKKDHPYGPLYESVRSKIKGACSYCATAFGASDSAKDDSINLVDEYEGHPSISKLIDDGYSIITF